jgi:uncharacterized protein (DUF3084 family)
MCGRDAALGASIQADSTHRMADALNDPLETTVLEDPRVVHRLTSAKESRARRAGCLDPADRRDDGTATADHRQRSRLNIWARS